MKRKRSRPTFHLRKKNTSILHQYSSATSRESYLGSTQSNETLLAWHDIFQRRVLKLHTINQAHIHNTNAHPVNNETLDLYSEGATLSKFINEGRPTTTKPTSVALPSSTSHSTFHECLRGILCQPQDSPHSPLTRPGVIISYSLRLERKITLPSTSIICWNITMESIPKKLIYSTSRNSTTFQDGILSSNSLMKSM